MIPSISLSLQIRQQFARITSESEQPKLEIRQQQPEQHITQTPAKMEISQGPGNLQIDPTEAWAALGCKSMARMTSDIASQAQQVAYDAIATIVQDGNQMAAIEKGGDAILDVVQQHMDQGPMPINDYGPASNHNANISYTPRKTEIHWQLGGATISTTSHAPEINYTPGPVHTYLAQKNWLEFDVKGKYMNMTF